VRVGTAGWSIPRSVADLFATNGSVLSRYASRFSAVEVNSSFYRTHRETTYERWAQSVPSRFRFAVKAPRQVTHLRRLVDTSDLLPVFRNGIGRLGEKLGPVLFQLPPSLAFDGAVAGRFFATWRELFDGVTVCEPRHPSWFSDVASNCLAARRISRVIADPRIGPESPGAADLGDCAYFRWHGSPVMYESAYGAAQLDQLARRLAENAAERPTWCIFDNTKFGAATMDAVDLERRCGEVTGLARTPPTDR
jgi:uncharacterized protein YecE (DUF72 family)